MKNTFPFRSVLQEPYRILFPLGFLLWFAGIGWWMLPYLDPRFGYPAAAHAALQMKSGVMCFVFGFLLTMMPKLFQVPSIGPFSLALLITALLGTAAGASFGFPVVSSAFYLLQFLVFIAFAASRFPKRKTPPPAEFAFLAVGFFAALVSALFSLLHVLGLPVPSPIERLSWQVQSQGLVLLLVIGIGSFLIPKLFGTFDMNAVRLRKMLDKKINYFPSFLAAMLILLSYVCETGLDPYLSPTASHRIGYGIRALVASWVLFRIIKLPLRPSFSRPFLYWVWAALWGLLFSQWAGLAYPQQKIAWDHLLFIFGFMLLTLGIASMVTVSHSAHPFLLNARWKGTAWVAGLVTVGAATRIAANWLPQSYFAHLAVAAVFLLLAMGFWLFRHGKLFMDVPTDARGEEC